MARRRRDAFEKLMDSIWGSRVTDFFRAVAEGEFLPELEERVPPRKRPVPRVVTPYDILGVSPTAPRHIFEACYRAWAKQLHPDVTGDGAAMRRINVAADAIRRERGWK
jgi:DnaJ-class molecular chaperone